MSTNRDQLPERTIGDSGNFPTYLFSTTLKCILHTEWAYSTPEATELSKVIHIKYIGAWEWLSITNNNLNNSYNSLYFGSLGSFIHVKLFFFKLINCIVLVLGFFFCMHINLYTTCMSYSQLRATMWLLGIKYGSSRRAESALNL